MLFVNKKYDTFRVHIDYKSGEPNNIFPRIDDQFN